MNILLIGFMAGGKSTIAVRLAEKLRMTPIDVDTLIAQKSGRASDREIFDKDGEIHFRELETAVAKDLQSIDNAVIATGGGFVMNSINILYLRNNAITVYLCHSFATASKRVDQNNVPPLFRNQITAKQLYTLRLPIYEYYANITIITDHKPTDAVTEELVAKITSYEYKR